MNYTSFYGGRRGASFVIVKKYKVIDPMDKRIDGMIRKELSLLPDAEISPEQREKWLSENCMIYCFKKGGEYKTVNYDEYVLIDTDNKNDKDNGKVYRRGYEYNNNLGGAVYVGQIQGPAGMAPHVEMTTIDKVDKLATEENLSMTDINGEHLYRKTEGEYAPLENLIPGKYEDEHGIEQYNDSIKFMACSVRDADSHLTTAYIGFKFPYTVIDYEAKSVSPYYHRTNDSADFINDKLVDRLDDKKHPFYEKWHISVPKGIKGETFNNLRVTTVAAEENKDIKLQNYPGIEDDKNITDKNKREILVFDYYNYDKDGSGEPVALYLGDYNMIENLALAEDGTVTIDYSHDNEKVYPNLFKWIEQVTLNKNTGLFEIIFNYPTEADGTPTKFTQSLTWVKDMTFDEYGTVHFIYTDQEDKVLKNHLKWVKDVSLNPENGLFEVNFNYDKTRDGEALAKEDTKYSTNLRFVKNIRIDEDGTVHFDYTYGEEQTFDRYIKVVKEITLDGETGHLKITYNQETDKNNKPTLYETDLRWVNGIEVAEDGTITVNYTTGQPVVLDNKIKWIVKTELLTDGTFIVTYNDKTTDRFEKIIQWISSITFTDEGVFTIHYNNGQPDLVKNIKWIKQINLALDGTLTVTYNDNTQEIFDKQIQWIDNITLADDGTFTVTYNNNQPNYVKKIVWPVDLEVQTGVNEGEGNQKLKVTFNNQTSKEIGKPINYIIKTAISDDFHLLALYSDPEKRALGPNKTYDGRTDWVDLGFIGAGEHGAIISKESDEAGAQLAAQLPPYSPWIVIDEQPLPVKPDPQNPDDQVS